MVLSNHLLTVPEGGKNQKNEYGRLVIKRVYWNRGVYQHMGFLRIGELSKYGVIRIEGHIGVGALISRSRGAYRNKSALYDKKSI